MPSQAAADVIESSKPKESARRKRRSEEILKAAQDLFLEKGFEKTAVTEIAQKVGVVEGLVFRYFPTKRDLLHEVLHSLYEPLIADVDEGYHRLSGLKTRLRFLAWRHLRVYVETPKLAKLVLHEVRTSPEYMSSGLHDLQVKYTQPLMRTLLDAIEDGELPKQTNVEMLRASIYGTIEHYLWPVLFGRAQIDLDKITDELTGFLLHGMLGPNGHMKKEKPENREIITRLAKIESMLIELKSKDI